MKLKVGDVVEFKKYEDLSFDEMALFSKDEFPQSGKVKKVIVGNKEKVIYFFIEGNQYSFGAKSVSRVISDVGDVDINSLNPGEEVWVKATVNVCYDDVVFLNPIERFINKDNVLRIAENQQKNV
ncbi:hypothetical protein [Pediococcus pentosaceus]|uniref:hypothetical protein n=1 Tax=Pediococcus pentosaceus TaxID=1255 RepID=UPI0018A16C5D|nr:hypothetical protein [Pediococcus pentosaceus]MBF7103431.1 hypothetical protein [Pediococcus pentosaceus]